MAGPERPALYVVPGAVESPAALPEPADLGGVEVPAAEALVLEPAPADLDAPARLDVGVEPAENPILADAQWPPLADRQRAAGRPNYLLEQDLVDAVPPSYYDAANVIRGLLDAARVDSGKNGARDAQLLSLAGRIANYLGWTVAPYPQGEEQ